MLKLTNVEKCICLGLHTTLTWQLFDDEDAAIAKRIIDQLRKNGYVIVKDATFEDRENE